MLAMRAAPDLATAPQRIIADELPPLVASVTAAGTTGVHTAKKSRSDARNTRPPRLTRRDGLAAYEPICLLSFRSQHSRSSFHSS